MKKLLLLEKINYMNIFKELAYGNGTVGENSVNAFLAYLLNPNKDHGLNDAFLKSFLGNLTNEIKKEIFDFRDDESEEENYLIPNLHNKSNYNVDVFVEKIFTYDKNTEKKAENNRVDIILKITRNSGDRQSQNNSIVFDIGVSPVAIFLIEVKISDSSATENQIKNQLTSAIKLHENTIWKNKIYHIYISPDERKSNKEFHNLQSNDELKNKCIHVFWDKIKNININKLNDIEENKKAESNSNYSVLDIIKLIVKQEEEINTEPIDDYCKQTLKAFCNFITAGFTGKITENKTKEGRGIPVILKSLDDYFILYRTNLNPNCNDILVEFDEFLKDNYQNLRIQYSKTHPIAIFTKLENGNEEGIKIGSLSRNNNNIRLILEIKNIELDNIVEMILKKISESNFVNIRVEGKYTIIIRDNLSFTQIKDLFTYYFEELKTNNIIN